MKKFFAPVVLFILLIALIAYLSGDFLGNSSSFDSKAYLSARSAIDSLEVSLWEAQNSPEAQVIIRGKLDSSWDALRQMRSKEPSQDNSLPFPSDSISWIVAGIVAVVICIVALVLLLKRRKEYLTQKMEALNQQVELKTEVSLTPPKPRPKKTSIIADAEAYAAKKRETLAQQAQPKASEKAPEENTPDIAFEDENGIPENKILTGTPSGKPTLRPTARERITSAMQNLSDVLRAPRGLSREHTMKLRAQSRNVTGNPNLGVNNPMEQSPYDKEDSLKIRILQMSRRGFPASAIASSLKVPQEKVETIIKDALG